LSFLRRYPATSATLVASFFAFVPLQRVQAQVPPDWSTVRALHGHSDAAMAYDAARRRIVLFGGFETFMGRMLGDTWEWDGVNWVQASPRTTPSPRGEAAIVYDAARQRIVLFGGVGDSGPLADTWEWDGLDWVQRTSLNVPSARHDHRMAYDAARQRVVLVGGISSGNGLADTWEWDGANWTLRSAVSGMGVRFAHAMAYDVARQRVVLYGGASPSEVMADTWEWDGIAWTQRNPLANPGRLFKHAMAYDLVRQRIVLMGGANSGMGSSKTWEWTGIDWVPRVSSQNPGVRSYHSMAYDAGRQRVVLVGGLGSGYESDTWEWDGLDWSAVSIQPAARMGHGLVYDMGRRRTVLFGGANGRLLGDTWEWDGGRWQQRAPRAAPLARRDHAMVYDAARQRVIMFGGAAAGGLMADTWEWDGAMWMLRLPQNSPTAREMHAMAYDNARQRVVLFGGRTVGSASYLSDTWEWDGNNWQQLMPGTSPPGLHQHAMAFHVGRQRVVLFGGFGNSPPNADTWEWSGFTWSQRTTGTAPARRFGHAMAYDAAGQRVVLFGGNDLGSPRVPPGFSDVWDFDGVAWTQRSTGTDPGPHTRHAMVYEAARDRMLVFGGAITHWRGTAFPLSTTWLYSRRAPAQTQSVGVACASAGSPDLRSNSLPYLGNPRFELRLSGARPFAAVVFGLAASRQPLVFGACTLQLQVPFITLATMGDAAGFASMPRIAIPSTFALRGAQLFGQAFAVDAQSPPFGLAFTPALVLTLGD
jgi:hypothetical protein